MARNDGTTDSGNADSDGGSSGGVPVVDIGSHIEAAASAADSGGSATKSGRIRRTREQLIADGYYEGKDTGKPSAARSSRPVAAKGSLDVNSIQFALTGIHALLAAGMAAPELVLSETEAETVAKNVVAVARHYDLQQTAKATDWGNLIVSLGVVYGGRIIAVSVRKNKEKAARRGATAVNTGFVPTAPNVAPQQPQVKTPERGPSMAVQSRPKTREDDILLNEVEPFLAP